MRNECPPAPAPATRSGIGPAPTPMQPRAPRNRVAPAGVQPLEKNRAGCSPRSAAEDDCAIPLRCRPRAHARDRNQVWLPGAATTRAASSCGLAPERKKRRNQVRCALPLTSLPRQLLPARRREPVILRLLVVLRRAPLATYCTLQLQFAQHGIECP